MQKFLFAAVSLAFLATSAAFATTISVSGSGTDGALAATAIEQAEV